MAYGLSNGHVTDDVTWPQRCCEAVRSAITSGSLVSCFIYPGVKLNGSYYPNTLPRGNIFVISEPFFTLQQDNVLAHHVHEMVALLSAGRRTSSGRSTYWPPNTAVSQSGWIRDLRHFARASVLLPDVTLTIWKNEWFTKWCRFDQQTEQSASGDSVSARNSDTLNIIVIVRLRKSCCWVVVPLMWFCLQFDF